LFTISYRIEKMIKKIDNNREILIKKFEKATERRNKYQECYEDNWVLKKVIRRLLKFKYKYLKYLFSVIVRKSLPLSIQTFWGDNFHCFLPGSIDIYITGLLSHPAELKLTFYFVKYLHKNCIFFDAGAHYGFYTLLARRLIVEGEIHSFEPSPHNFNILKKNVMNKSGIILNNLALYNKGGKILFYTMSPESSAGDTIDIRLFLRTHDINKFKYKKIHVPTMTLNEYCKNNHIFPDFIKIDVEGAEQYVIEGATDILTSHSPIISLEIWKSPMPNESHLKAVEILYSLGYKSYFIKENGELELKEKFSLLKCLQKNNNENFDNFIFKKD